MLGLLVISFDLFKCREGFLIGLVRMHEVWCTKWRKGKIEGEKEGKVFPLSSFLV
jgi:hypothetical protein